MDKKIKLTINGRQTKVNKNIYLLEALRNIGIEIPSLCSHPSLNPSGECRLCSVEIAEPERSPKMVASCLFPVSEGLTVFTHSARVMENRKTLLKLYLAHSPESEIIRNLARQYGVDTTPFPVPLQTDNCIKCGLCIRTCQNLSTCAISALNRSIDRDVGPGKDVADDCIACLSCSFVCPTKKIKYTHKNKKLTIWNKTFEIPVCSVNADKCSACGICEETCPFKIPCVSLFRDGSAASSISADDCMGCGICAGSCPNGAITQKQQINACEISKINKTKSKGKKVVFMCSRSQTDLEDTIIVPCVGAVNIETVFEYLAMGADGVALICRDRATCPYGIGGKLAEKRVHVTQDILEHIGIGKEFIQFITPEYGKEGPDKSITLFRNNKYKNPLRHTNSNFSGFGFEKVLEIAHWIKVQEDIEPKLPNNYNNFFGPNGNTALYLGNELVMDMLLSLAGQENINRKLISDAVKFLKLKGITVKPVFNAKQSSFAEKVYTISPNNLPVFSSSQKIIILSEFAGGKSKNKNDNTPVFNVTAKERRKIIEKAKEKRNYTVNSPEEATRVVYVLRKGSWQEAIDNNICMIFSEEPEELVSRDIQNRITSHPIKQQSKVKEIEFWFNEKSIKAKQGEVITSALYAAGITVFGYHHKDKSAQGIYCVNGQCSQCMVVANGKPVKACMVPVLPGMRVESVEGFYELPECSMTEISLDIEDIKVPVLIIGGGPSGIAAAIELGRLGINVLIVDDKQELGGKLSLQTHNFFGSVSDCFAGTRGMDIGQLMADELNKFTTVKVWLNTIVVGVYVDNKFGMVSDGQFRLVTPEKTLIATGAREKSLAFPGSDLPGVYGAGAFQTLVNRDLIKCAKKLFVIGGGNVGLITAYHALQAGIDVVGLVEALPVCGGYKVHEDKIKRLGVPVWTSHTILKAEGIEKVEKITIASIDEQFRPVKGTERTFDVDTILVAVGLASVNEFLLKAQMYGMDVYSAGDAKEIAEASAAIFSGKIAGRKIAQKIGISVAIPSDWESFTDILKHHSAEYTELKLIAEKAKVHPVARCVQEIPCDPCVYSCPKNLFSMKDNILSLPEFKGNCIGCGSCVKVCPGLAITLVFNDYDVSCEKALVMLPFEFVNESIPLGCKVTTTDMEGNIVGQGKIIAVKDRVSYDKRKLLLVEVPEKDKLLVAGFRIRDVYEGQFSEETGTAVDDPIICRCERIRKSEIVREIRHGVRDMNQLKFIVRTGMGSCGGKTCTDLIMKIYKEEGIVFEDITLPTFRPLLAEVHLGDFASKTSKSKKK